MFNKMLVLPKSHLLALELWINAGEGTVREILRCHLQGCVYADFYQEWPEALLGPHQAENALPATVLMAVHNQQLWYVHGSQGSALALVL